MKDHSASAAGCAIEFFFKTIAAHKSVAMDPHGCRTVLRIFWSPNMQIQTILTPLCVKGRIIVKLARPITSQYGQGLLAGRI